tara:strand:- start:1932 stop:2540 length:609 start_codon:yes stop_codon:yes gene_type:complete
MPNTDKPINRFGAGQRDFHGTLPADNFGQFFAFDSILELMEDDGTDIGDYQHHDNGPYIASFEDYADAMYNPDNDDTDEYREDWEDEAEIVVKAKDDNCASVTVSGVNVVKFDERDYPEEYDPYFDDEWLDAVPVSTGCTNRERMHKLFASKAEPEDIDKAERRRLRRDRNNGHRKCNKRATIRRIAPKPRFDVMSTIDVDF